ncbi:MAG: glutathione S-transferase family protein [Pseudomonadota bacterium]
MALKLYHSPGTRSIRPLWLLEEMGLPYELVSMRYSGKYFASDEYRAINPMGKIPALYDGDALIIESIAIMEYLLQRHGPSELSVASSDPEYATYLQWLHMAESGFANYVAVSFGHSTGIERYKVSEDFDKYCRFQVTKGLDMLEALLADREYVLKRGFSAADISLGYSLFFAKTCIKAEFGPNVKAYFKTLCTRPAFQKAMADMERPK